MYFVARTCTTTRLNPDGEPFVDEWHVVETLAEATALYDEWLNLPTLHNLVMGPIHNSIDDHLWGEGAPTKES